MIQMNAANDTATTTQAKLSEIQQELRNLCAVNTDEFYNVSSQRGFTTIVVPQSRKRA